MSKIGAGHATAMGRLGLAELRNAAYSESNIAQSHSDYGLYGVATPQEVLEQKGGPDLEPGQESPQQGSILDQRMAELDSRTGPEIEPPEPELER